MTDDRLDRAQELRIKIRKFEELAKKAELALTGCKVENPTARTSIRVSVPSARDGGFDIDDFIYPTHNILTVYIESLQQYIALLKSEFDIL